MKKLLFAFLFFLSIFSSAQQDSCKINISLLTCTPGDELYSTFGHSAIRIVDSANNTDLVFNYGTFDFNDPQFYTKFTRGKLLYFVSVDSLPSFLWEYQYYKRGVTEQVLNLSCEEKKNMFSALLENAKEENKYYKYDFNYDNCTTRLRDILEKTTGKVLETKNILPGPKTTFRSLIHDYLDKGGEQWSKLGIDILLGYPLDKKVTNREAMFLPEYLLAAFDSSTLNNKPLIVQKNILLIRGTEKKPTLVFTPLIVFGILFLLIVLISFLSPGSLIIFDFVFFLLLGLLGAFLIFMWFGTDHHMTKDNFNLLWALPLHLPVALFLFSKKNWLKDYFRFIFFYSLALLAAWFLLPQHLNISLLPIVGIVLVRSYFRSKE